MKQLRIAGALTVDDACSEKEALLRLSIRLKQLAQSVPTDTHDWQGSYTLETV